MADHFILLLLNPRTLLRLAGIVIWALCVILHSKDAVDGLWHLLVNIYDLNVTNALKYRTYGYRLLVQ